MTRNQFENLVEEKGFEKAMSILNQKEEPYLLTNYETLKERVIELIQEDNIPYAAHLIDALESEFYTEGEWFAYDYTAGTCDTPKIITTIEDVEKYIGFDEEE